MGLVNGTKQRIDEMFAFVAVDEEDGTEGVCSVWMSPEEGHMPLIGADMNRVESLRPAAELIARQTGLTVRLVKFVTRVDLEEKTGNGAWEKNEEGT